MKFRGAYTDEFLIEELHRWVEENGRVPTTDAWDASRGYPSRFAYTRRFGSWPDVLTRGGYTPNKRGLKPGMVPVCSGGNFLDGGFMSGARSGERGSIEMRQWRDMCLERDNHACSMCGAIENIGVHHILTYNEYPELRTELMNGYTVCQSCHKKIHAGNVESEYVEELTLLKISLLHTLLTKSGYTP